MIVRLEIEGDLLSQVEAAARGQRIEFKEFVSSALRNAVAQAKFVAPTKFTQKVHDFGTHLESPWTLLADLETSAAVLRK
jgi:hypothetical protein